LKNDKDNYNAYVFIGVAAEGIDEFDQALKAYTKAAEISPEQLLAWQGLSGFYEKHDRKEEYKEHQISVYKKLVELQSRYVLWLPYYWDQKALSSKINQVKSIHKALLVKRRIRVSYPPDCPHL
jgi:tetratricopeptide (TPR) repeat protein